MTVSLKRLIAFVVLIAMALAGTPTIAMATDGLKTDRYGFKSKEQQVQVAQQTPANLNRNPFRDNTVSATLSGASIRVDQATVAETNIAVLLATGTTHRAIAQTPATVDHSVCQIHLPVFENVPQGSFYEAWLNAGHSAIDLGSQTFDKAIRRIEIAKAAEMQFVKSLTAASGNFATPIVKKVPVLKQSRSRASSSLTGNGGSTASIRNINSTTSIQNRAMTSRPTTTLKRRTSANIWIEMLAIANNESFEPGQHLLIEEYLPPAFSTHRSDVSSKPRALSVPVMSIGYQRKTPAQTLTARSLIRSAKAIIKSIIQAIEPMIGLQRANAIPRQLQNQLFQIDELVWSTSNLKHIWNIEGAFN